MVMLILFTLVCSARALHTVPVGVVMVEDTFLPFSMEMIGPALDIAYERVKIEFGIEFERYNALYPTFCNADLATGYIADLYHDHEIQALIGPACSQDINVCGKLATYYGLPMVSGVGDIVLSKEEYPTFTRLSYSLEKQSDCFTAILDRFNWTHVAIIYDIKDFLMLVQGDALSSALREDPRYPRPFDIEFDSTKNPDFREILLDATAHARVMLFLSSGDDLREFMLAAYDLGYCNGDFAFITIELFRSDAWGDFSWLRGDSRDEDARRAFESLLFLTLTVPSGPVWDDFAEEVELRAFRDYNYTFQEEVNYFVGAFYDSVIYLAQAYNVTLERGLDPNDGRLVAQALWNTTFKGIMGDVYVDSIGDKLADYSLLDMTDLENGVFEIVGKYYGASGVLTMEEGVLIEWPGTGVPPPDVPACGFRGEEPSCVEATDHMMLVVILALMSILLILGLIGGLLFRYFRYEADIGSMSWKVNWEDVIMQPNRNNSTSRLSLSLAPTEHSQGTSLTGAGLDQMFTTVGNYRGNLAAIRKIAKTVTINRTLLMEMKQMRDVQHDNLTRFIGACIEPPQTAILTEYCPKGSLQDILANDAIKLDWTFRYSLTNDVVRGLGVLQSTAIGCHGRLTSSNCVVDGRFVLKLTDYGLPSLYYGVNKDTSPCDSSSSFYSKKYWRAPEFLECDGPASAVGDIYSLGVIMQEIVTRTEPYDSYDLEPREIIKRVAVTEAPPFRPMLDRALCRPELFDLIELCWAQDPSIRPSITSVRSTLKKMTSESSESSNILDNLLQRMETYAENLETLVEERTLAFLDEKKKSEDLLYRVLPRSIAEQLKKGHTVAPEKYECVTIYFSDIVGFTAISASSTPLEVVNLLNDLYTCFDAIIDQFNVYKVETIGDAYMVVSGLPVKNGFEHARQIARMSLALLRRVHHFKVQHRPHEKLKLRIGLHSGPCVAGVVGLTMPRYCLFGDTVNTASRMESTGEHKKKTPLLCEASEKHSVGTYLDSLRLR